MTNTFHSLPLQEVLIEALNKQDITEPLPIQSLAIPAAIEGKNIIAQAHTGSGKTLAYLLPLFQKINITTAQCQAIIIAPTHELVVQINDQIKRLATNSQLPITSAILMGGMNIEKQIERLKKKPHIIVGSSGRILELIKKKKLPAHTIKTLIIDEADNLLEKNQSADVLAIIKACMRDTQLMLFSATISEKTKVIADSFMSDPLFLNTCEAQPLNPQISHYYTLSEQRKKVETLRKLLHKLSPEKTLIFVNNTHEGDILVDKLHYHKFLVGGLSSKQNKQQRETTLQHFKTGKINVLVSSDLSARGLDIPSITHVINLDLPIQPQDYLHRAGRTARGFNTGTSISILTDRETRLLKDYEKTLGLTFQPLS